MGAVTLNVNGVEVTMPPGAKLSVVEEDVVSIDTLRKRLKKEQTHGTK